jgi:hypothetical protein
MFKVLIFFASLLAVGQQQAWQTRNGQRLNLPIEVLTLDPDIAQAIAGLTLARAPSSLLLPSTHGKKK